MKPICKETLVENLYRFQLLGRGTMSHCLLVREHARSNIRKVENVYQEPKCDLSDRTYDLLHRKAQKM